MKSNSNDWLAVAGTIGIAIALVILGTMVYKTIKYAKSKEFDLVNMVKGLIEPK